MSKSHIEASRPVAVVTGGANGLGKAISAELCSRGDTVVILDIDDEGAAAHVAELRQSGFSAFHWNADCTDLDAVEWAFGEIKRELGAPRYLVNNVGGSSRAGSTVFLESDVRTFDDMLALNLKSTVYCSRQVVEAMRDARQGRIVNIASDGAFTGGPAVWDYAPAKAGVIGFSRSLALELAPFGVNVNVVGPGPMETRAIANWSDEVKGKIVASIPMARIGQPHEVADTVAYLLSDEASYITGQTLLVNGARWMI